MTGKDTLVSGELLPREPCSASGRVPALWDKDATSLLGQCVPPPVRTSPLSCSNRQCPFPHTPIQERAQMLQFPEAPSGAPPVRAQAGGAHPLNAELWDQLCNDILQSTVGFKGLKQGTEHK